MYYLDTNICVYYLNGSFYSIRENLLNTPPCYIKILVIVHSDLVFGAFKSRRKEENLGKVQRFLAPFEIVYYTSEISKTPG